VADIGTNITTVEKKLEDIFQLASQWEAVLLFDEADVLLETRTDESPLERNAMVSGKGC
jgi:SpoVK/Ycf46/Vps4 family AAA+-type ATPase